MRVDDAVRILLLCGRVPFEKPVAIVALHNDDGRPGGLGQESGLNPAFPPLRGGSGRVLWLIVARLVEDLACPTGRMAANQVGAREQ